MRVEESVEIRRAREDVWAFVADPANDPRWCPKIRSIEPAGPNHWRVMHRPVPLRPPMQLDVEHLSAEPPARLRMRETDSASVFDVEYRLEPTAAGTRFTQVSEFEWKRLPRILHRVFARGVRRDLRAQMRELKRVLEAQPRATAP